MCFITGWQYRCNCKHLLLDGLWLCADAHAVATTCPTSKVEVVHVDYPCRDCEELTKANKSVNWYADDRLTAGVGFKTDTFKRRA